MYKCFETNGTNQCNFGTDYEPGIGTFWKRTWGVVLDTTVDDTTDNTSTGSNDTQVDISKAPGTPTIGNQSKTINTGSFTLNWAIAKNTNPGTIVKLSENNTVIKTILAKSGESFSSGTADIM